MWRIRYYDVENEIIGFLIIGGMMLGIMFTKKRIMCNAYARMNCINSIDTVEKIHSIIVE